MSLIVGNGLPKPGEHPHLRADAAYLDRRTGLVWYRDAASDALRIAGYGAGGQGCASGGRHPLAGVQEGLANIRTARFPIYLGGASYWGRNVLRQAFDDFLALRMGLPRASDGGLAMSAKGTHGWTRPAGLGAAPTIAWGAGAYYNPLHTSPGHLDEDKRFGIGGASVVIAAGETVQVDWSDGIGHRVEVWHTGTGRVPSANGVAYFLPAGGAGEGIDQNAVESLHVSAHVNSGAGGRFFLGRSSGGSVTFTGIDLVEVDATGAPKPGYVLYNGAHGGSTSSGWSALDALHRIETIARIQPLLVINDCGHLNEFTAGTDAATIVAQVEQDLRACQAASPRATIAVPTLPRLFDPDLAVPGVMADWARALDTNERIKALARRYGYVVADVWQAFGPTFTDGRHNTVYADAVAAGMYEGDGIHPTVAGAAVLRAQAIAATLGLFVPVPPEA